MDKKIDKKKKRRPLKNKQFQPAAESSFQAQQNSQKDIDQGPQHLENSNNQNRHMRRQPSSSLMKNTQVQTAGGQSVEGNSLPRPYQFLKCANPSAHMIFFPHFSIWTVNFGLSVLLTILFVILISYSYSKTQNDFTWNCSLYQLQNKYFPRLRYSFQFWRVIISAFFHSNIAHFCLNVFGLQVYGYFVEWYYGKVKYMVSLLIAIVVSHFFAAAVNHQSISTMSSSLLFCVVAMKIWFLWEYYNYKPLQHRKLLIYMLLSLIILINLIPIFVVNNVDFTSHVGGFIVGGLMGAFFHFRKQEQNLQTDEQKSQYPKKWKIVKWGSLVMIGIFFVVCVAVVYSTDTQTLYLMNTKIDDKCK